MEPVAPRQLDVPGDEWRAGGVASSPMMMMTECLGPPFSRAHQRSSISRARLPQCSAACSARRPLLNSPSIRTVHTDELLCTGSSECITSIARCQWRRQRRRRRQQSEERRGRRWRIGRACPWFAARWCCIRHDVERWTARCNCASAHTGATRTSSHSRCAHCRSGSGSRLSVLCGCRRLHG